MNTPEQIQKNETVTYFKSFDGACIYRESQSIVIEQNGKSILILAALGEHLINAIRKAME